MLKRCNFRSATVPTFIEGRELLLNFGKSPPASAAKRVAVGPHARQLHRRLTLVSLLHHSLRQGALPPHPPWCGTGCVVMLCQPCVVTQSSSAHLLHKWHRLARGNNPSATSSFSLARVLSRTSTSTPAPPQPASSARVSIMPCTRRCFLAASLCSSQHEPCHTSAGPDGEFGPSGEWSLQFGGVWVTSAVWSFAHHDSTLDHLASHHVPRVAICMLIGSAHACVCVCACATHTSYGHNAVPSGRWRRRLARMK
jgi:hypothetical protein